MSYTCILRPFILQIGALHTFVLKALNTFCGFPCKGMKTILLFNDDVGNGDCDEFDTVSTIFYYKTSIVYGVSSQDLSIDYDISCGKYKSPQTSPQSRTLWKDHSSNIGYHHLSCHRFGKTIIVFFCCCFICSGLLY